MSKRIRFTSDYVPNRYPDKVQRHAVLYPLTGWPKGRVDPTAFERETYAKAESVRKMWRNRIFQLYLAGWSPANGKNGLTNQTFMSNCRPTFFVPKQNGVRCCNRRAICPFCYARWVRLCWARLDFAMFVSPNVSNGSLPQMIEASTETPQGLAADNYSSLSRFARKQAVGMNLMWCQRKRREPIQSSTPCQLSEELEHQFATWKDACSSTVTNGGIKSSRFAGGLQSITIEPIEFETCWFWEVTVRNLFVIENGLSFPTRHEKTDVFEMRRGTDIEPKRKTVMERVAELLRYPSMLLRGNATLVAAGLAANEYEILGGTRVTRNLNSYFGCIRKAGATLNSFGLE